MYGERYLGCVCSVNRKIRKQPKITWTLISQLFNKLEKEKVRWPSKIKVLICIQIKTMEFMPFYTEQNQEWMRAQKQVLLDHTQLGADIIQYILHLALYDPKVHNLEHACASGNLGLTKYFIPRSSQVERERAFNIAVFYGQLPVVSYFVDQHIIALDESVLYTAIKRGHPHIFEYLAEQGLNVDAGLALNIASNAGHLTLVRFLMESGGVRASEVQLAFLSASDAGYLDIVEYFIKECNINLADDDTGKSALCFASSDGNLPLVQCLVEHGAPIENYMVQMALENGHAHVVQYLLQTGANAHFLMAHWNLLRCHIL